MLDAPFYKGTWNSCLCVCLLALVISKHPPYKHHDMFLRGLVTDLTPTENSEDPEEWYHSFGSFIAAILERKC